MVDTLQIAVSGLRAHQQAIATTGHNITNANTPGYSKQQVIVTSNAPQSNGIGSFGSGVQVTSVIRQASSFLTEQLRTDTSIHSDNEVYLEQISSLDDLLGNPETGINKALDSFFTAVQRLNEAPASTPTREALLSETQALVKRFHHLSGVISGIEAQLNQRVRGVAESINGLIGSIAEMNLRIADAAGGSNAQPNDLLDRRDEMVRELSQLMGVSTQEQENGMLNIFSSSGEASLIGTDQGQLVVRPADGKADRLTIDFVRADRRVDMSDRISGGELGGIFRFRSGILDQTKSQLGIIALGLSESINEFHRQGINLDGQFGGNFFRDINEPDLARQRVFGAGSNALPDDRVARLEITDVAQLSNDNYQLEFVGPGNLNYRVIRSDDAGVVAQGVLPGIMPTSIEFDGLSLKLESGSFQQGDVFYLRPTEHAASDIDIAITDSRNIAWAAPVRARAESSNVGTAVVSAGQVFADAGGGVSPTTALLVRFVSADRYQILDNSNPANPVELSPPLSNQIYSPTLQNNLFPEQLFSSVAMSDGSNAEQINAGLGNGYLAETITVQYTDVASGGLTTQTLNVPAGAAAVDTARQLSAFDGVSATADSYAELSNFVDGGGFALSLNGQTLTGNTADAIAQSINSNTALAAQNIVAESNGIRLIVRGLDGADLQFSNTGGLGDSVQIDNRLAATNVLAGGQSASLGGRVQVQLDENYRIGGSGSLFSAFPDHQSAYTGFQFSITGNAVAGDEFVIEVNNDGVGDNRNGLSIVALQTQAIFSDGSSISDSYSGLLSTVGNDTRNAQLNKAASENILNNTTSLREQKSGVNLDEEAARLIQLEQAYNASAQVIGIARGLFQTLIDSVG